MRPRAAPSLPSWTLPRARLEERLDVGAGRRLTAIIAGAGYGKSTLVARWAAGRDDTAWYSLDSVDRSISGFVQGVVAALEPFVGDVPGDVRAILAGGSAAGSDGATDRADALADMLSELLADRLQSDVVLVLDDFHEVVSSAQTVRTAEGLLRGAPATVHFVLISRGSLPFPIERLRGQGQVIELSADRLAFTESESAALLAHLGDGARALAPQVHALTNGWPAAVRLAAETLVDVAPADRAAVIERLGRPEGPLFAYVAEEVIDREPEPVTAFLRCAARLEWFDGPLLEAVGVADATTILTELRRRALFIEFDAHDETYAIHRLLRGVVVDRLPMSRSDSADLHRRAARWLESRGRLRDALGACLEAGDPAFSVEFLTRNDERLLSEGLTDGLVRVVEAVPVEGRPAQLERLLADALMTRGDFDGALRALDRAGGGRDELDPSLAWRIGLILHQRGDIPAARVAFDRARLGDGAPADVAMVLGWKAYAVWTIGDPEPLRPLAEEALQAATRAADDRALSVAYLAAAAHANAGDQPAEAERLFALARAAAERAGWPLLIARAHNDLGFHLVRQGRFAEALREDDAGVTILRTIGDSSFQALALADRGEAHLGLGHYEEALADLQASLSLYDRIGSRWKAWAILRQAMLHARRGDAALAKARFEDGLRVVAALADELAHSEMLAGLARVVAADDPHRAAALVEEALEVGRHGYRTAALLVAAELAAEGGDPDEARRRATEVIEAARPRHDRPSIAGALEVLARIAEDGAERRARLDEAAALWRDTGSPHGLATNLLLRARIVGGDEALSAAVEAERIFREIGARGMAGEAEVLVSRLRSAAAPPVAVESLGGFRVLRDGVAVPSGEWQSKKARDLLKILVARRGRAIARDALCEALWPDEDAAPLANRLSVALTTVRSILDPGRRFPAEQFVVADKSSVALDLDHISIDVEAFLTLAERGRQLALTSRRAEAHDALVEAEATYAGDFLAEDPYEDWAAALREEAQATYVGVARTLAGLSAGRGDVDGAIRLWLRVLERDPFDESAHLELVTMLMQAGRHGEARRRFGVYVERMEEIGVEAAPFPAPRRAA